jgi:hypothetical protein
VAVSGVADHLWSMGAKGAHCSGSDNRPQ